MWKIIKSELKYYRTPVIVVWAFFILMSLFSPLVIKMQRYKPDASEYLFGLLIWIVILHMVFVFIRLMYETRENRTLRYAQLPLNIHELALAKVLATVVFFFLSVLLIVVCYLILLVVYPTPMSSYSLVDSIPYISSMHDKPASLVTISVIGIWLGVTFGLRMFSEWQGRFLLGIALGLILFYTFLLRVISYKLVLILKDFWFAIVHVETLFVLFSIFMPLVLMALLYIFFRTRRSYVTP